MFGVFGIGVAGTVLGCILAFVLGFSLAMLGAAMLGIDGDDPFGVTLIILL